jgi:AhpD family alkylhydroperoxidase
MRVEGLERKQVGWVMKLGYAVMRRRYGKVITPAKVWARLPAASIGTAVAMWGIEEVSKGLDPKIKRLANLRTAQMVGCPFCIDIISSIGRKEGISDEQMSALGDFERSPLFTAAERAALRYVEEMCATPVNVSDATFEELKRHLDSTQIVELTAQVALENLRSRFNRALEIPSDGFCTLPASHPVSQHAVNGVAADRAGAA